MTKLVLVARYILCAPRFLGWLFPILAVCCFAATNLRLLSDGVLVATWRPWVASRWKYSMAFSAGLVLQPGGLNVTARTIDHELVHVRQTEDGALLGLLLGVVVSLIEMNPWYLLLWPLLMFGKTLGWLGAVLRGGHVYRDAEHERSAYAQTDMRADGSTWLKEHITKRLGW